ncbi:hypothetical protein ACFL00_00425 [Pseudomonadota bacterium]
MNSKISEEELLNRLAELPRERSPGRDPWPEIFAAIDNAQAGPGSMKRRVNGWFMAAAASIMLAIAAGLILKPWFEESAVPTDSLASTDPVSTPIEVNVNENPGILGTLDVIDAEYVAAFREFMNAGDPGSDLAPQTVENIEKGWADLRMTEEALMAALDQNPDNLFLNERMVELRTRQLGYLQQLVSLERNNRRLTI